MSGFNSDSRRDELQKRNAVILIPALDPPMTLEDYIKSLVSAGFDKLIIVNDGSSSQPYRDFFRNLNNMPQCHLLTHARLFCFCTLFRRGPHTEVRRKKGRRWKL